MSSYKIKEISNPSYELLLKHADKLNIKSIDMELYKNILLIYLDKNIIGMINYCIVPSMKKKDKLYIRNIHLESNSDADKIIKLLCEYCESKSYSIFKILDKNEEDNINNYLKILYENNFVGEKIIYHI